MIAATLIAFFGVWLMAAPGVFGFEGDPAAGWHQIAGPFIATFGCIALGDCTRNARFGAIPFAAAIAAAPLIVSMPALAAANAVSSAIVIVILCFVPRSVRHTYAGGWMALFRRDPYGVANAHPQEK